jgi:hypothetical protein
VSGAKTQLKSSSHLSKSEEQLERLYRRRILKITPSGRNLQQHLCQGETKGARGNSYPFDLEGRFD